MTREVTSDYSMLERLIEPAGKDVVDVGCGPGALVRELARNGARPVGIEVSEDQLAAALALDDGGGASYRVGRAQDLPLADDSTDIVVFQRSLHHIPPADLTQALREARRVLRADGLVYVSEPLPEGSYFVLTSLVEDEVEVRAAAQRALAESARAGLERVTTVEYEVRVLLAGPSAFRDRTVAVDPGRAELFDRRQQEIAAAFERIGQPGRSAGRALVRSAYARRRAAPGRSVISDSESARARGSLVEGTRGFGRLVGIYRYQVDLSLAAPAGWRQGFLPPPGRYPCRSREPSPNRAAACPKRNGPRPHPPLLPRCQTPVRTRRPPGT